VALDALATRGSLFEKPDRRVECRRTEVRIALRQHSTGDRQNVKAAVDIAGNHLRPGDVDNDGPVLSGKSTETAASVR
jgi:hypothetical protein